MFQNSEPKSFALLQAAQKRELKKLVEHIRILVGFLININYIKYNIFNEYNEINDVAGYKITAGLV